MEVSSDVQNREVFVVGEKPTIKNAKTAIRIAFGLGVKANVHFNLNKDCRPVQSEYEEIIITTKS